MANQASEVVRHLRQAVLRHDGAGLTDGQLLGFFVEHRDEAAFAALVHRHGPMVWGTAIRPSRYGKVVVQWTKAGPVPFGLGPIQTRIEGGL